MFYIHGKKIVFLLLTFVYSNVFLPIIWSRTADNFDHIRVYLRRTWRIVPTRLKCSEKENKTVFQPLARLGLGFTPQVRMYTLCFDTAKVDPFGPTYPL